MIRRFFVRTRSLEEGMKIDQNIKDRMDRVLIARGTPLNDYLIESLKKLDIGGVYIQEGEEDPEPAQKEVEKPIPAAARNNI